MALSLEDKLGPAQREHRARPGAQRAVAIAGWTAVALALVAGVFAAGRALFAYQTYGPLAVDRWSSPPAMAAGGFVLVGVLLLLLGRGRRGTIVRQHARGLVIQRGRKGSAVPWDEIREIHTRSVRYGLGRWPWGRQGELILVTRDGRRFHLDQSLSGYDELAETVKRSVYPTLLDAYTRAFNHGQALPFGPLSLTPEGLHNGRKTLHWQNLAQARLERGWLEALPNDRRLGPRLAFPARSIPNVDLCLQLIQELTPHP